MSDLQAALAELRRARSPDEIFGPLAPGGRPAAKKIHDRWAHRVHPDHNPDDRDTADKAFALLEKMWVQAEAKMSPPEAVVLSTRMHQYTIVGSGIPDGMALVYPCTDEDGRQLVLKMAANPVDNDLLQAEAAVLKHLRESAGTKATVILPYLPDPVESFVYDSGGAGRQATVFTTAEGLVSLADIRRAYPDGIDPQDMAWMWRRLLMTLDYAHSRGVIHGAVLPTNVLIHPELHGLVLVNWHYTVRDPAKTGARIKAIDPEYRSWYPAEVLSKSPPVPAIDLVMSARCMVELMGGDPIRGSLPDAIDRRLRSFFLGCTLETLRMNPQDAWTLRDEFTNLIEQIWGRRTFRPFAIPTR
jgi:serine/threonine protein kinase